MGERVPSRRRPRLRMLATTLVAGGVVVAALQLPGGDAEREGGLGSMYRAATDARHAQAEAAATKNDLSRGGQTGKDVQDPTTAAERAANAAYVAAQRRLPDPRIRPTSLRAPRTPRPTDRYAMADGCYTLAAGAGVHVVRSGAGLAAAAVTRNRATPFFFKATDLGDYLLHGVKRDLLTRKGAAVTLPAAPSNAAVWTVTTRGSGKTMRFALRNGDGWLARAGSSVVVAATPTWWDLRTTAGCAAYPEAGVDVTGAPHRGVTRYQEVRGYVDGHTHGMAFEFLGGRAHCGKPWDRFGAPYALRDCPDHEATGGYGALLETVLSGEPSHDPVGWPTFKDWPAPESLTHEGTYWKWLERSWRGGQRLFVNLLVENNKLCQIYPLKKNSCDDMDSIRLQAKDMYALQDYIDAQYGGPGRGFYRIVTNPFQARKVINSGRMAVVMGIETSVPFGCTMKVDRPQCTIADIDRQMDEVHRLGVRQMELVNKFDNALAGVAGDEGATGVVVNAANFLETGSFWDMEHCAPADGESHDRNQFALGGIDPQQQDALFGAIGRLLDLENLGLPNVAIPLYGKPDHCNSRGLTTLGKHTIEQLVKRRMIFDPDHLSVKARKSALDQIERLRYPGVISSHSWATPDSYPRVYRTGGFITPYAGDSSGFVEKWRRHLGWADKRYYYGIGYGADINGLGAQGDPRGADVKNKVTYPFRGMFGQTVHQQTAGQRRWDINVDGVAQYGLYPDWIEDLRKVAGRDGAAIVDDMSRGAEAYLQMWERSQGIRPDSCRNPALRKRWSTVTRLVRRGMSTVRVMRAVGQPYQRLGRTYRFCAKNKRGGKVTVKVVLSPGGKVTAVKKVRRP
ncbi:hypothetical protein [Nocardioides sp. SYSU D00038]|uniref:hypothetical protein n=1 Tax=Nocardioides sp. SYSU D00038 TaxID=2812554 RepID=UPI0019670823|nr:hypothetical protein [Nocardioides sp. SYSU D00038]